MAEPPTEKPRFQKPPFRTDNAVSPTFVHRLVAHADEIDALGHVSNIVYLKWIQDAAAAHSAAVGWDLDAYERTGTIWVVRNHNITYYAPVFEGDAITCETWVESWKGASSPRRTRVTRDADGAEVARCETLWAHVDMKTGRPRRIPEEMRGCFKSAPRASPR